jgi:hypothetical protein
VRGLPPHGSFTVWSSLPGAGGGFLANTPGMQDGNDAIEITLQAFAGRF